MILAYKASNHTPSKGFHFKKWKPFFRRFFQGKSFTQTRLKPTKKDIARQAVLRSVQKLRQLSISLPRICALHFAGDCLRTDIQKIANRRKAVTKDEVKYGNRFNKRIEALIRHYLPKLHTEIGQFTEEMKKRVVRCHIQDGRTIASLSAEYRVSKAAISNWIRSYRDIHPSSM